MAATSAEEVLALAALRSRAERKGHIARHGSIRLAILGGYTFRPLDQLLEHYLSTSAPAPLSCELLLGDFDNYTSEIVDEGGRLGEFKPEVVVLVPSHRSCRYSGPLFDSRDKVEAEARNLAAQILDLCSAANRRTGAEIILANFPLSGQIDPGPYRGRTFASEWSFRKLVNLELGIQAPAYVHICDVEFLSARHGIQNAFDPRAWFETRQPYERGLMLSVARELAHLITHLRTPSKKVAILDLDNTLWGGVIGDDGLNGIEIGDTSPRGEAFKWFQQYLLSLSQRGVLLAACSKNDHDKAIEPFERHPEMVLRMKDFVSFKANWQPKSENIRQIAAELNLGLDSMVFIDDNPAEVDIVRQFVPEVAAVLLGPDPSEYVATLQAGRFFEPQSITSEDLERVSQYKQEAQRQVLLSSVTDMGAYLASLDMTATVSEFRGVDVPRIAQLINKSNQFNLTTRRRTEAQVEAVIADKDAVAFTVRLSDRFGDYGLISVVVGQMKQDEIEIDTWLMSCRVLKRQVEELVLNNLAELARKRGARQIRGVYLPTPKNGMVRDHYAAMGFTPVLDTAERREFILDLSTYEARSTHIRILKKPYDSV